MDTRLRPCPASIGSISWTNGIQEYVIGNRLGETEIKGLFRLFLDGCFGQVPESDWEMNMNTIREPSLGSRIMGVYKLSDNKVVWIITSGYGQQRYGAECCHTVIMFPSEY